MLGVARATCLSQESIGDRTYTPAMRYIEIEGMRLGFRRRDLMPITPATDPEGPA